jgi:RNA polymerase sigma factor (sigma-70 family)
MPVCPQVILARQYQMACMNKASGGAEEINQLARAMANRREKASADPESGRLFLLFAPLILRESRKYCQKEPGCELDCLLGDLHTEAYLSMLDLHRTWDPKRADFCWYAARYLPKRMARAHRRLELRVGSLTRVDLSPGDLLIASSDNIERRLSVHKIIARVLSSLSPDDRDLIHRRYLLGQSWEKIREACGITPAAAKQKYWRAMVSLRKKLSKMEEQD